MVQNIKEQEVHLYLRKPDNFGDIISTSLSKTVYQFLNMLREHNFIDSCQFYLRFKGNKLNDVFKTLSEYGITQNSIVDITSNVLQAYKLQSYPITIKYCNKYFEVNCNAYQTINQLKVLISQQVDLQANKQMLFLQGINLQKDETQDLKLIDLKIVPQSIILLTKKQPGVQSILDTTCDLQVSYYIPQRNQHRYSDYNINIVQPPIIKSIYKSDPSTMNFEKCQYQKISKKKEFPGKLSPFEPQLIETWLEFINLKQIQSQSQSSPYIPDLKINYFTNDINPIFLCENQNEQKQQQNIGFCDNNQFLKINNENQILLTSSIEFTQEPTTPVLNNLTILKEQINFINEKSGKRYKFQFQVGRSLKQVKEVIADLQFIKQSQILIKSLKTGRIYKDSDKLCQLLKQNQQKLLSILIIQSN